MAQLPIHEKLDRALESDHMNEPPFRAHLGGSMIGRACDREIWYGFRWAKRPTFPGRILRLFGRGHLEEFRFVQYLARIGIEVRGYSEQLFYHPESGNYVTQPWRDSSTPPADPEIEATCIDVTDDGTHVERAAEQGVKLSQWRIKNVDGHFGGSLDGIARAKFDIFDPNNSRTIPAGEDFLTEFKTHNVKSFVKLTTDFVKEAKYEHWCQMQIYMHERGLKWALYLAVNKNDDDLHFEVVEYIGPQAAALLEKARTIIHSRTVPNRLPGARHASWHECKFCSFKDICHYGAATEKNCRTCISSVPVEDGKWRCTRWDAIIPSDAMLVGCDNYKMITD